VQADRVVLALEAGCVKPSRTNAFLCRLLPYNTCLVLFVEDGCSVRVGAIMAEFYLQTEQQLLEMFQKQVLDVVLVLENVFEEVDALVDNISPHPLELGVEFHQQRLGIGLVPMVVEMFFEEECLLHFEPVPEEVRLLH